MWQNNKTDQNYEQLYERVMQLESKLDKFIENSEQQVQKEKYLDISSACRFLGISRVSIYRLMQSREIGFTYIGRQRRILVSELKRYINKNNQKAF